MADVKSIPLTYKGHPLRRKDNIIYYGSMAEKYIIMLQIHDSAVLDDFEPGHQSFCAVAAHRS